MEVKEHLHLSPMRGMGDIDILSHMCSSMGYPHIEHVPYVCTGSNHALVPFDVGNWLVASFVVIG